MNIRDSVRLEIPYHFTHDYGNRWDNQRHMPFAAIGAAISGAISGAVAAGAGAAVALGATAGGMVATAAGAISAVALVSTYVGIGLTVVGAVTGNTKLMKIGGMVGLAGGVVGLGVGAVNAVAGAVATTATSAASSAAPAASVSSPTSAIGGLGGSAVDTIGQQVGTAITPTFASQGTGALATSVGAAPSLAATGGSTIGGATGPLSEFAANTAVTPQLATPALQSAPQAVTQSASFFDQLLEPKTLLGITQLGGAMMSGSADAQLQNQQLTQALDEKRYATDKTYDLGMAGVENKQRELDISQQKADDEQSLINRRYNDLNSPGGRRTGVEVDESVLPREEKSVRKANVSKQVADILAPKKKPTGVV